MRDKDFSLSAFRAGLRPDAKAAFDEIDKKDQRRLAKMVHCEKPLFIPVLPAKRRKPRLVTV